MLNIASENSIDAIKKLNIVNKDVRVTDEVRNEIARNTAENSSADDQIFENVTSNDNFLNLEARKIYAIDKFNTRRSNQLIKIENLLNKID